MTDASILPDEADAFSHSVRESASRSSRLPQGAWRWILPLAVIAYALLLQGWRPLYSPDEGRYTNVALNMIESGDWMRPMLHPEVEHWAKPPLTYWMIAASIELFGRTEFAARLPSAAAFGLTVLVLVRIGRRLTPQDPWLPALIYATCAFPAIASNLVTTDTLLALWESLQAFAFLELWSTSSSENQRFWRRMLWLAAALAFMTKGPPGLLALIACGLFAAIRGRWTGLRKLVTWDALLLFVVVGGAWYVSVIIRETGVWRYFLVEEVVNRVATDKMHRNAEWYGALKVYGPTLLLGTLPWLPFAIYRVLGARLQRRPSEVRNDGTIFLLCWILVPLALFVLVRSRLPLYVLPLFAPLALAMARALSPIPVWTTGRVLALCVWGALIVASRVVPAYVDLEDDDRALAKALRDEAPVVPDEVAFVEVEPRFGLRFYLNSEVERLDLPGEPPNNRAQDIGSEMLETEGCRLLLVSEHRLAQLQTYLADHSIAYIRLPDARGFAVLAQSTADCSAYAAPSSR